jgi:transcriptional regulator with XRE-family HTH domain
MSQEALAVSMGIDETTVANWEHDKNQPMEASLRIVKGFFGSLPFKIVHLGMSSSPL